MQSQNDSSHEPKAVLVAFEANKKSFLDLRESVRNCERTISQLSMKLNAAQLVLEVIQSENDAKRSEFSKIQNWTRRGDVWMEDVNEQMDNMMNQLKVVERTTSRLSEENTTRAASNISRTDLDVLETKIKAFSQENTTAHALLHDKIESRFSSSSSQLPEKQLSAEVSQSSEMLLKGKVTIVAWSVYSNDQ